MRNQSEAWRRRLLTWVIPLAVCTVNAIGVAAYHVRFAGSVEVLQGVKEEALSELSELQDERQTTETFLAKADERERMVKSLYEDHFATEAERLTEMIREAKRLARQAGLEPKTISYPEQPIAEGELTQRRMIFPVQGTYDQLRMFMNFLELTDQFITLEGISLSGNVNNTVGREPVLSVQLELSTVFVTPAGEKTSGGTS